METKSLNDICIENMLQEIFTSYSVRKRRRDIVSYYNSLFIKDLFGNSEDGTNVTEDDIKRKIDEVLKEDKNAVDPFLKNANGYYFKAKRRSKPIEPTEKTDSNYIGKAGECAVMSELLFRGYNVNNMMVDEGIDLVASKSNVFYYIQVKTKNVEEQNKFYFQIKRESFGTFIGTQIRYVLVAHCKYNNEERNMFFTFSNNDIQRFMSINVIPVPSENSIYLSIKIEFDSRTGKVYMYDGRFREDVTFYMNRFEL